LWYNGVKMESQWQERNPAAPHLSSACVTTGLPQQRGQVGPPPLSQAWSFCGPARLVSPLVYFVITFLSIRCPF
jgi:hypothetical protein